MDLLVGHVGRLVSKLELYGRGNMEVMLGRRDCTLAIFGLGSAADFTAACRTYIAAGTAKPQSSESSHTHWTNSLGLITPYRSGHSKPNTVCRQPCYRLDLFIVTPFRHWHSSSVVKIGNRALKVGPGCVRRLRWPRYIHWHALLGPISLLSFSAARVTSSAA